MPKPIVHVLFTPSGAATLRQVLKQTGARQKVLCAFDDFSFGPIGRNDVERIAWIEGELGITDWALVAAENEPFLRESCSSDVMPIVWTSRSDARSQAGFHWWLSHRGDAPSKVIDVAEKRADAEGGPWLRVVGLDILLPNDMVRLLGTEVPFSSTKREACQKRWRKLIAENAAFRVMAPDGSLVSAPITWFDPLLLSCATTEWVHPALIVEKALAKIGEQYARQTTDIVLFARLFALVERDMLEWRDVAGSIHGGELRLPPPT